MPEHDQSVVDLLKTALRDAQDLVQSEIALAKAELRHEARRMGLGAGLLAGAAVSAVLGLLLLMMTVAWGLAAAFEWPVWIGLAGATALALAAAAVLAYAGRRKLSAGRRMPHTMDTMKENTQWIRARTS